MTDGKNAVRILVVDDHAVVRAGLRLLFEGLPNLQVVGEAGNREEALTLARREQPGIILLDIRLGAENSLEFLPDILAAASQAKIIVLTGTVELEEHRRAIALGAMGLVRKEQAATILIQAIERVQAGEVWIERSLIASVLEEIAHPPKQTDPEAAKIASLTEREREIIVLVGQGLRNPEISNRLFISDATVRHHLNAIFRKLDVTDRLDLVLYAYRHRLAEPPCTT